MQHSLDRTYFRTIAKRTHGDYIYTTIRPIDSPMILFSKVTGDPLVSLHFKAQQSAIEGPKTVITKRPQKSDVECDFQGIINQDGQEFELVITNLTKLGKVNFNVLKGEKASSGLNQVNVIKSYESHAIQCDKEDNKSLILNAIKKDPADKNSVKLTVGEAESKDRPDTTPKGTYYFLSVVPEKKQALIDLFKETTWACQDLFVLKEKTPSAPTRSYGTDQFGDTSQFSQRYVGQIGQTNRYYDSRGLDIRRSNNSSSMSLMLGDDDLEMDTGYDNGEESYIPDDDNNVSEEEERGFSLFDDAVPTRSSYNNNTPDFNANEIFSNNMINIVPNRSLFMDCADAAASTVVNNSADMNSVINKSFAANVSGGRRIDISSVASTSVYNYSTPGEPCVLGLSVSDNLDFKEEPSRERLEEESKILVDEIIASEFHSLIDKLKTIYKEETCTICLDDDKENPPDTVFYQCGHQCCHYACGAKLDKCPLCRTFVTASIRV
jgi:hypothetical protein